MTVACRMTLALLLLAAAAPLTSPAAAAPAPTQDADTCTLTVCATPVIYVEVTVSPWPIDGDDWGMTDTSFTYHRGEEVSLTLPMRATFHSFAYCDVDGITAPAEVSTYAVVLTLTMDEDHTATAHYDLMSFPDVPPDYWAYQGIMACWADYIVEGYPDGLYHPESAVTRDQMAVFIARGGARELSPPEEPTFTDVPPDHWAYASIEHLAADHVVEGYDDGTYRPGVTVTRGQTAVFIARDLAFPKGEEGLADYQPPDTPTFTDVPTDYWCFRHVEFLAEHSMVEGYPDGAFQPTSPVARDQMAVFIAHAFFGWHA
jgi:hypothetical protein